MKIFQSFRALFITFLYDVGSFMIVVTEAFYTGCLKKKRNTFALDYLKDGSIKIVLLVCYSVLPYNSIGLV